MTIRSTASIHPEFLSCAEQTLRQLSSAIEKEEKELMIGLEGEPCDVSIAASFHEAFVNRKLSHRDVFQKDDPLVHKLDGSPDYLSTIIYMVNYLQEVGSQDRDEVGRYKASASYQHRFDVFQDNLVRSYLEHFHSLISLAQPQSSPSRLFVSHDNDGLFRGFKQDGFYALKKGRLDWLLQIIFSEVLRRPRWFNMDQIMDINDEYGLKSTFFWLVRQGDVDLAGRRLRNADYSISDPRILGQMKRIERRGFEQGLHKSISQLSFKEEINQLPFKCHSNRNHFLRVNLPEHFSQMDQSGLAIDFTLGFAEEFGLRNSYALPYRPFDIHRGVVSNVIYVPLMIMDTTNWTYRKSSVSEFKQTLLDLVENHRSDALISILWHNKYFTNMKFKGYLSVYKEVLELCRELGIHPISQQEIISNY